MFQKKLNYFDLNLKWDKSEDVEYPFQTNHEGYMLQIRLNDFPEEQMYSLIVNDEITEDFDDWPENWSK
jgi:hypothetical protein